jgi:hypothetical protein
MLAGVYMMQFKKTVKHYLLVSLGAFAAISTFAVLVVGKWYEQFTLVESPVYQLFLPFVFWSKKEYLTQDIFWVTSIIAVVIFMILIVFTLLNKRIVVAALVAGMMLYQYEFLANTCYKDFSDNIYADNYPVYEMITKVEEQSGLDKTIYLPAGTYSEMALQFYLNRYKFILDSPEGIYIPKEEGVNGNIEVNNEENTVEKLETESDEVIVFVRKRHLGKVKVSSEYKQIRISGIGKLYIKGEELCKKFEKAGYKVENH